MKKKAKNRGAKKEPEQKASTKRELVMLVPAEDVDEDAFANAMADAVVNDIQRWRKKNGLPPLEE
jgi:hypothetical protein